MTLLTFTPLDTLFFRDGRPYNRDESNAQVVSQFPPFAPTLIGATRAAFARRLGWPAKDWQSHVKAKFGDGEDLGPVSFSGPYVMQDQDPLFPVPSLLLRAEDGRLTRLRPGRWRHCDLGEVVRLPEPQEQIEGLKEVSGWLTRNDMARVLAGDLPQGNVVPEDRVFGRERRVGNYRDPDSRTVREDNAIYSPAHIRLAQNTVLALLANGLPEDLEPDNPAPTGGEGRLCWIERSDTDFRMPDAPDFKASGGVLRYCAILVTPLDTEGLGLPQPESVFASLPGTMVSACIGRSQRAGGWLGAVPGGGEPLSLRSLLPAGSVLFMQAEGGEAERLRSLHGTKIGARLQWGFGQVLIGSWEDR